MLVKFSRRTTGSKEDDGTSADHPADPAKHEESYGQICRLCANISDKIIYIFSDVGKALRLPYKINTYLPISVTQTDTLPKQLCLTCVDKLQASSELAESSLRTQEMFTGGKKSNFIRIDEDSDEFSDGESTDTESFIKETSLFDSNKIPCPVCPEGEMKLRETETMSISLPDKNTLIGDDSFTNNLSQQNGNKSNFDLSDTKENLIGENSSRLQISGLAKRENDCETIRKDDGCNDTREESLPVKEVAESETSCNEKPTRNSDRGPNTGTNKLTCVVCNEKFDEISDCLSHYKNHMPQNICGICEVQFSSEGDWEKHFHKHMLPHLEDNNNYQCEECHHLFASVDAFNRHNCDIKQKFACDTCSISFLSEICLGFHEVYTHGSRTLKCFPCKMSYFSMNEYLIHLKLRHCDDAEIPCEYEETTTKKLKESPPVSGINPLEYQVNGEVFLDHNTLKNKNTSSQIQKVICDFCEAYFDRKAFLLKHLLEKHANVTYQTCYMCRVCQEALPFIKDALEHSSTHPERDANSIDEVQITELYLCEYCESCFAIKSDLLHHYAEHDSNSRHVCKDCKISFTSYGRLLKHKTNGAHCTAKNSHKLRIPKLFLCKECGKSFPQWNSIIHHRRYHLQRNTVHTCNFCNKDFELYCDYKNHRKIHAAAKSDEEETVKPFICSYCGKAFALQSTLNLHQRVHSDVHPYSCGICGESFRLKSLHDKHLSKHAGIKPFMCNVCGKGFTQNSGLYTHRRMHTGEKPYSCDICQKTFRLKHDRDNHRRCHTGERPYKCSFCNKAFRTNHDHRQHLLIHTGQRPYRCTYCGKGFRRINGLNVHKRIHTGEKPYGCEICGRHFTQKGDMMKHRRTQHGFA